MPYQDLLFKKYLDPTRLKLGKDKCPCCGKLLRSYCKSLDQRLVQLFYEIMDSAKNGVFNPRGVFKDDHQKINDFQKLGYWNFIERTKRNGLWSITNRGIRFVTGKIQVPKRVWVFNNKVVLEEDELVDVARVDPRWQTERRDWSLDYIPKRSERLEPRLVDGEWVAVKVE